MLDNTKCSSSFDPTVVTATVLLFEVSDIFPFLFLHMGTIVVLKQELGNGYTPVNNTHVKQFTEKKTQSFICILQVLCRNTIRPWSFVEGQLLNK